MNFCQGSCATAVLLRELKHHFKDCHKYIRLFKDGGMQLYLLKNAEQSLARCKKIVEALEQLQKSNKAPARDILRQLFRREVFIADEFRESHHGLQLEFLKAAATYGRACLELSG